MNKKLNLSGNVKVDFILDKDKFVKGLKEDCLVSQYASGVDSSDEGKFKLGLDEVEFNLEIEVEGKLIKVAVYLQLSIDGKNVKVIETFTGLDYLINVEEYHYKLSNALNKTTSEPLDLSFTFNGYVK